MDGVGESEDLRRDLILLFGWGRLNALDWFQPAPPQFGKRDQRSGCTLSWLCPSNAVVKQPFQVERASAPTGPWTIISTGQLFITAINALGLIEVPRRIRCNGMIELGCGATKSGPASSVLASVRGDIRQGVSSPPRRRLRRTAAFRLLQRPQSGRASIFSNAWAFPGRHLSSNTESDLDTNVVRTLMQPEGCGPSEFSRSLFRSLHCPNDGSVR